MNDHEYCAEIGKCWQSKYPCPALSDFLQLPSGERHEGKLQYRDGKPVVELATCGTCGFTWNDALITGITPTPAGRCPNEYRHPQIVNGTYYNAETSQEVIDVLERCRANGTRIRVHYGDAKTGQDWGDLWNVTGKVSRSMGPHKIPILVANARSMGGGGMLDACIVRIRHANRKDGGDLYRHPKYQPPNPTDYVTPGEYERNFA